ncbi:hypothetical protein SLE2022_247270 [Rubroshorea leprosula]
MLWRILHPAHSLYAVRTYPRDCGPPHADQEEVHDELMISSDDEEECVVIESSEFESQNEDDAVHEVVSSSSTSTRQSLLPADTHSPPRRLRYSFRPFPKGCGPPSRFTSSAADDDPEEELELVVSSDDEGECVDFEAAIEPESEAGEVDEMSCQMLPRKRSKISRHQRSQAKKLVQRALNSRFRDRKSSSKISSGSNKKQRIG